MKTKTTTQIKLPDYAVEIALNFQKRRRKYLFPKVHLAVFNERLKKIGELAGWTETVEKVRKVKGESGLNKLLFS